MQLKDLKSGQRFLLKGEIFIKINCYGDMFGLTLCKDEDGENHTIESGQSVQKVIET